MSTISQLRGQWINPSDVSTILMVIGGDVVHNAFAQGTGQLYTPVCFSFGCVAYAFITLVNIIGDGRLLPRPDYPVKVFNLESGYVRENKNWVVGRLLRDIEGQVSRERPWSDRTAIRISVFEAMHNTNEPTRFSWTKLHAVGAVATVLQLAVATIPIILDWQWGIMLITVVGTLLIQITGLLPQWRAEKLPNGQQSHDCYALTSGNGSTDIVVIIGKGLCLNLEEMSAPQSPRVNRPWEKFEWLSKPLSPPPISPSPVDVEKTADVTHQDSKKRKAKTLHGFPLGFRLTQITSWVLSVLWLLLLVNLAATVDYTWCILGVGAIGMFQNAWLAAVELPPANRNIPLWHCDTIMTHKVMDGIMDFDVTYGRGMPLMEEFFPGRLHDAEIDWWRGNKKPYDDIRKQDALRGTPRSVKPVPPTSTQDPRLDRRWSGIDSNDPNGPRSLDHIVYEPSAKRDALRARDQPKKGDGVDKGRELGDEPKISGVKIQPIAEAQDENEANLKQPSEKEPVDKITDPFEDPMLKRLSGAQSTSSSGFRIDPTYEKRAIEATRSPDWT